MEQWLKISILLCIFGFLKELRPIEPFIFEYLIGPWWNMSEEDVQQKVYPVSIYGYLLVLIVVFLFTDLCRYKPLIIVMGLCSITVWSLLIWGSTLLHLQVLEVAYGTFMAAEIAYYTYIYAKVPKEYYPQVTAHTRAAILAGRCISGSLAQVLLLFEVVDYRGLCIITMSSAIVATSWALLLPSVPQSIYFHQDPEKEEKQDKYRSAFLLMKSHFVQSFSKEYVVKWSVWWAFATAGYNQLQAYSQPLWSEINDSTTFQNGTVEAIVTLVGCLGALSTNLIKINWERKRDALICACSILSGSLLLVSSQTQHIVVSYACYVVFGGLYHFVVTIGAAEIAKCILEDSYGLVFGLNTFIALVIQTLMTLVLVSGKLGVALDPREQHIAYGVYQMVIAVVFTVIGVVDWIKSKR